MTENEAKNYIESYIKFFEKDGIGIPSREPYDLAISALEEIQQYRALGTVEELRETMEKQRAKKPVVNKYYYFCSNCGARRSIRQKHKFCHNCGQSIDWSGEE